MPAMLSSMPPIDTRQIERAVERGRARMESIAETISTETMSELLDDLRHEAAPIAARAIPMIERATGRRRKSRKPKVALAAVALLAIAGIVAYLFWQRRDEEPAYLVHEPDQPDLTPAQTPPIAPAPSAGPSAPAAPEAPEATDDPTVEPPARTTEPPAPVREFAGAPHAIFGLGDRDSYEDRPTEGGRTLPDVQRSTFAPTPVRLPSNARRSWLPR
jgi:hypothetical protein